MGDFHCNLCGPLKDSYFLDASVFPVFHFNPIQDGAGGGGNFPVTSTNLGPSPQNFLTFGFDLFATLV